MRAGVWVWSRSRALVVAGVFAAVPAAWPAPAWASCAVPLPLEQAIERADVVLVGDVVGHVDGDPRRALFDVDEVRKGGPLPERVEVSGTPGDAPGSVTSVDRTYVLGRRYLVVASGEQPPFSDNACSATTQIASEQAAGAPVANADRADAAADSPSGNQRALVPLAAVGVVVAGLVGTAVFVRARVRR